MRSNFAVPKHTPPSLQAFRLIFRQPCCWGAQETRSVPRGKRPARLLLLFARQDVRASGPITGIGKQTMGFDGFFALPIAAQAGIIAFGVALMLLVIAQLLMASSLRNRSHSAALEGLRNDVRALSQTAGGEQTSHSSNGLAPPPRPIKRRKVRRQSK